MKSHGRLAKQAARLMGILAVAWLSAPTSMGAAAAATVTPSAQPTSSGSRVQVQLINDIVETNPNDLAGLGIDPEHGTPTVFAAPARQLLASTAAARSPILREA